MGRAPQGPASRIGRGGQGLDHMTQADPTGHWVTVRLVATRPAGPVVKILTYFHPVAPGPGKLLPEGLASCQETAGLPMTHNERRAGGRTGETS